MSEPITLNSRHDLFDANDNLNPALVKVGDVLAYKVGDGDAFSYHKITKTIKVTKITNKSIVGVEVSDGSVKNSTGRINLDRLAFNDYNDRVTRIRTADEQAVLEAEHSAKMAEGRKVRLAYENLRDTSSLLTDRLVQQHRERDKAADQAALRVWQEWLTSDEGKALAAKQNEARANAVVTYDVEHPEAEVFTPLVALVTRQPDDVRSTDGHTILWFADETEALAYVEACEAYFGPSRARVEGWTMTGPLVPAQPVTTREHVNTFPFGI